MPYVQRDANGKICGIYANPQDYASEYLDDADPAVVAYLAPPPPPPVIVSQRQARLALAAAGLLDQVNQAVAAADQATQITWDYASEIRSDDPLVATIAIKLGLSAPQISQLFAQAATL